MENCMQVEVGEKGIDIDDNKYRHFNWYVVVFRMTKSKSIVRRYMEEAFDSLYGRPLASLVYKREYDPQLDCSVRKVGTLYAVASKLKKVNDVK